MFSIKGCEIWLNSFFEEQLQATTSNEWNYVGIYLIIYYFKTFFNVYEENFDKYCNTLNMYGNLS